MELKRWRVGAAKGVEVNECLFLLHKKISYAYREKVARDEMKIIAPFYGSLMLPYGYLGRTGKEEFYFRIWEHYKNTILI